MVLIVYMEEIPKMSLNKLKPTLLCISFDYSLPRLAFESACVDVNIQMNVTAPQITDSCYTPFLYFATDDLNCRVCTRVHSDLSWSSGNR